MCVAECKGDFYRGCNHFIRLYYTGKVTDCGQPDCAKSVAHMHKTAKSCYCTQIYIDKRLINNYIQTKCDECIEKAQRAADRGRRY